MEIVLLVVAGGAVGLAVLIAVVNKMKSPNQAPQETAGFGTMAVPVPPPPMPLGHRAKKQRNKRGWRAPVGHYFDDDDCLFTDTGDLILDMVMVAQLCGEQYDQAEQEPIMSATEECQAPSTEASCCSEASAEATASAEVTSKSDFSDLQTERHSASASYGGGESYDSGDSGGDCGGDDD